METRVIAWWVRTVCLKWRPRMGQFHPQSPAYSRRRMPSVFEKSLTRSANKRTWQRIAGMAEARELGCLKSGADSQPCGRRYGRRVFCDDSESRGMGLCTDKRCQQGSPEPESSSELLQAKKPGVGAACRQGTSNPTTSDPVIP